MKKINIFAMIALLAMIAMPAGAATITTGMTQVQAGGSAPVVKAKWEMNPTLDVNGKYLGTDDSVAGGAQFNAPGVKDQNRTITLCSIVTDDDGMGDIAGVYADVYYPEGIAVGPDHTKLDSQTGSDTAGCGVLMQEDKLTVLPKADGLELFCNKIRNNNNNLPTFNGTAYNYDEICKTDGELQKETAKVYCVNKDLSYEDPSGTYNVTAMAQDTNSLTGTLDNTFQYVPLTAFAADFTNVSYGNVKLNIEKIVNGDLIFGTTGMPTVRNVGNTRMNLTVNQNDMGLGKTGILWNVGFDARVGSNVPHQDYAPNVTTTLDDALNLSETDEVDFSILVNKFPTNNSTNWTGTMTLGAVSADHLTCVQPTRIDRTQPGFGDGGWAGWSCPAGTHIVGGGIDSSTNPVGGNGMAAIGAPAVDGFNYPVYPHYTFPAGETGYVVHDLSDGLGNTISFHLFCLAN